jgi:hypothetical protein
MNCVDYMKTLCWFQQIKQVIAFCKDYYYEYLFNELGFTFISRNPIYTPSNFTKDEILQNHLSVLNTLNIHKNQVQFELPYLYWILNFHKISYEQRFIAGSSKCSTKPLSLRLTKLLTAIRVTAERLFHCIFHKGCQSEEESQKL